MFRSRTTRWISRTAIRWTFTAILFGCLTLLDVGGCSQTGGVPSGADATGTPLPAQIDTITKDAKSAESDLVQLREAISKLTPQTVEAAKSGMLVLTDSALKGVRSIMFSAQKAKKDAVAVVEDNATLRKELQAKPDSLKTWLNLIGIPLFIVCLVALIASYWVPFLSNPKVEGLLVAGIVAGLACVTIARFLTAIYWIAAAGLLTAAACAALWVYVNRAVLKDKLKTSAQSAGGALVSGAPAATGIVTPATAPNA